MKEHLKKYFPERFDSGTTLPGLLTNLKTDHRKAFCQQKIEDLFKKSDELKLLVGAMRKYGCKFDITRHISCESCHGCQGGYDPDTNQIVVNKTLSYHHMFNVLAHEMIHMFDYCRANFDFGNLEHVACSEVSKRISIVASELIEFSFKTKPNPFLPNR